MRSFKFWTIFFITLFTAASATAQPTYVREPVFVNVDSAFVSANAYANISDAITAIGGDDRTLLIEEPEACAALTIPANVTLWFTRNGSIANTGQLTINTTRILAADRQVFSGTGDVDFTDGSVVRSTWFSDINEAFDVTSDDSLTLIIADAATTTSSSSIGNDVTLKWETSGNILTVDVADTIDNISQIEAGNYQIFGGSGDLDFLDGSNLKLSWFPRLRDLLAWVETEEVTIVVPGQHTVSFDSTTTANETFDFISMKGSLSINAGVTLTFNHPRTIISDLRRIFFGDGVVEFTYAGDVWAAWWNSIHTATDHGINIYVESGTTYTIASSIILENNQSLIGTSWDSVIQADTGFSDILITNDDQVSGNTNIVVSNLKLYGNGESCQGVTFLGDSNSDHVIEKVWFDYGLDRGLTIDHGRNCIIENNKITRFGAVLADGQAAAPSDDGIRITYPIDCIISQNYVSNKDLIVDIHGDGLTYGRHGIAVGTNPGSRVKITDNIIDTVERHGINVEGSGGAGHGPEKVLVTGNHILNNGTVGIVATSDYTIVTNNIVEDSGQNCYRVKGHTLGRNIIQQNIGLRCGSDPLDVNIGDDGSICGIIADGTGTFKSINFNTIIDPVGSAIYLERSLGTAIGNTLIGAGGSGIRAVSDHWLIALNSIHDGATDGINTAKDGDHLTIIGNVLEDNANYGIETDNNLRAVIALNRASGQVNNFYAIQNNLYGPGFGNLGDAGLFTINKGSDTGGYEIGVRETELTLNDPYENWNNAILAGTLVLGVTTEVTTAITGATGYRVGLANASDDDRYGEVSGTAVGTSTDGSDFNIEYPVHYPGTPGIRITGLGGAFVSGAIRVSVVYIKGVPPTE